MNSAKPAEIRSVDIRPLADQHLDDLDAAGVARAVKRLDGAHGAGAVHRRARGQQEAHHVRVAVLARCYDENVR